MEYIISLFFRPVFVDNMIFAFFLRMCSFLVVPKNVKTSFGLGMTATFVLFVTAPVDYLFQTKVLDPLGLSYLSFIIFIAAIASMTQLVEMLVEKYSPSLYASLGISLPLIAVNCAIMSGSMLIQQRINLDPGNTQYVGNIADAIACAVGSGLGWTFTTVLMEAIREKLQYSDVPRPLQDLGITFITVGLMAIAMMCFFGLKI